METKDNSFLLILKVNDKTVATRTSTFTEYNQDVIYSLRLNKLMNDLCSTIQDALKDKTVDEAHRLLKRGVF